MHIIKHAHKHIIRQCTFTCKSPRASAIHTACLQLQFTTCSPNVCLQGMHNARVLVHMEIQHNADIAAAVTTSDSEQKQGGAHSLSMDKEQPGGRHSKQGLTQASAASSHSLNAAFNQKGKHSRLRRAAAAAA